MASVHACSVLPGGRLVELHYVFHSGPDSDVAKVRQQHLDVYRAYDGDVGLIDFLDGVAGIVDPIRTKRLGQLARALSSAGYGVEFDWSAASPV